MNSEYTERMHRRKKAEPNDVSLGVVCIGGAWCLIAWIYAFGGF